MSGIATRKHLDAISSEILQHKLWQITSEMGTTLRHVSGSPITLDAKDYATGLMRPNGSLLMINCGVLFHAVTLPYAVQHLLEKYGDDPGINPGDVFLLNDPYICAIHAPDMYVISPIHHDGELVGWAGSMTHLVDIGGIDPGGLSPRATDAWQEGLRLGGVKLVDRAVLRRDVWDMILNQVRDPAMVGLDLNAQMACMHVARERVPSLIEDNGLDAYWELSDEIITASRNGIRRRLKELPDGTWRTRVTYDEDGHSDRIYEIHLAMIKRGSDISFNLNGTSEQAPSFVNCGVRGAQAGVFGSLAPLIAWDLPWTQGLVDSIEVHAPAGTIVRPNPPAPTSLGTIGAAEAVMAATQEVLAKMLMASDDFRSEFTATWGSITGSPVFSGLNQSNEYRVQLLMQHAGTGGGARGFADGVNTAGTVYIPELATPNAETYEMDLPVLFLYVRERADSGGPGFWRGGNGLEVAFRLHDSPERKSLVPFVGRGTRAPIVEGLFGGYPSANWYYAVKRGTNVRELSAAGQNLTREDDITGTLEVLPGNGVTVIADDDVFFFGVHGGGGYGDPVERPAHLVLADLQDGRISHQGAAAFGVVIPEDEDGSLAVDEEATQELRIELRGKAYMADANRKDHASDGRVLTEYLVLTQGDGGSGPDVKCRRCGHNLGPASSNYKARATLKVGPVSQAGPLRHAPDGFVMRRFHCPGCEGLLDAELCDENANLLHDFTPVAP